MAIGNDTTEHQAPPLRWPETPEGLLALIPVGLQGSTNALLNCILLRTGALVTLLADALMDDDGGQPAHTTVQRALWAVKGNLEMAQRLSMGVQRD